MELNSGELYSFAGDPLLVLLARECETEQDKQEAAAIAAERESTLLAAQAYVAIRQSQSS